MSRAWEALEPLDPASRRRTLRYLMGRCADAEIRETERARAASIAQRQAGVARPDPGAEWRLRFERANLEQRIRSDSERVLVVAAALQALGPALPIRAREIHRILKEMDYGVSNIASLLRSLSENGGGRIRRKGSGNKRLIYQVTEIGMQEARGLMDDLILVSR